MTTTKINKVINVGAPSYINAWPLLYALKHNQITHPFHLNFHEPTTVNKHLSNGTFDVALVSSAHFLHEINRYKRLSNCCIGATKSVQSVKLFYKKKLQKTCHLAIPTSSATSVLLLRILCQKFWKLNPQFDECASDTSLDTLLQYDGFLLIGDRCLQLNLPEYTSIDLATAWYEETNTAFVFALFAASHSYTDSYFEELLAKSYAWYQHNHSIVQSQAAEKLQLSRETIRNYFTVLDYHMNDQHHQGLELFLKMIKTL